MTPENKAIVNVRRPSQGYAVMRSALAGLLVACSIILFSIVLLVLGQLPMHIDIEMVDPLFPCSWRSAAVPVARCGGMPLAELVAMLADASHSQER